MANFKTTPLMSGLYGSMRYKPETVAALPDAKPFQYDPLAQLGQSQPAPSMGYQAYEPPKLTRQSLEVKPIRTRFAEFYHYERRIQEEAADMDALEKMQADMEMEQRKHERLLAMNSQFRSKLFQQAPQAPGMPRMNATELGGAALGGLITGDWENAIGTSYGAAQGREQQTYQGQMQEFERQQGMAQFDYRAHLENLERQGSKVAGAEKRMFDVLMGREKSGQAMAENEQKFQNDATLIDLRQSSEFRELASRVGPEEANRLLTAKYQKDVIGNQKAQFDLTKSQFLFPYEVREAALKNGISEANLRKIEAELAYLPQDKQLEQAKFLLDQAYKAAQIDAGNQNRALDANKFNIESWQKQQSKASGMVPGIRDDAAKLTELTRMMAGGMKQGENGPVPLTAEDYAWLNKEIARLTKSVNSASKSALAIANTAPPQVRAGAVQMGHVNIPLGVPYVWGGDNIRKGVDCSGLVVDTYRKGLGIDIGDQTAASMHGSSKFKPVKQEELQEYDLIFFYTDSKDPKRVSHVGIYMGGGKMLHASSRAGTKVVDLDTYPYRNRIAGYRRLK